MAHDPGDPRVDDLRQQLRSLGYLDAGVDRFVLGAARERRRPAAIAALVSLRIGALAALLIGPAAALGIAGRLPGLITGPRDGFVIALYVGALFGVGVALAALSAIAVVSWIAGRGERLRRPSALAAGLVVTLASLAYLTMWWDASTLAAQSETSGPAWTIVALALAAAVSVLIGHAVTVAALAVSVARGTPATLQHGVPGASWRVMTAIGGLTFCGALLLFHLTSRFDAAGQDSPSLTVVSSGIRLRLLAIDGFDPALAARLARAGRLPALDAALDLSAHADHDPAVPSTGRIANEPPGAEGPARAIVEFEDTRDPARLWTTIATGQPADTHAVRGLETRRVLGLQGTLAAGEPSPLARSLATVTDTIRLTRPSVVSREERRVKTLWEVASSTGLKTAVINWWATWPAPADGGIALSDRATLRLEHGGELDAEIAPPDLYDALRARWPALRQQAADLASPFDVAVLRRSAELDALQLALARDVTDPTTDLVCTYFPGLDLAQHALLSGTDAGAPSPSTIAARLSTLEEYYRFLDRLLAPALAAASGELVLVMTSPGRVQAGTSGLLTIRGVGANTRARDAVARPVDIAPTVLHALGLPISRELAGRALIELFSADFARRYPLRQVETYGAPVLRRAPRGAQPLDQEMIERLRSLGYLQ